MTPRVSGLLSVFNGEAYLADAIDSMLGELDDSDELIVVDDGSTDGTPAILERYAGRIITHRQDNAGLAAALNRALDLSSGELIAFNDADDLWEAGRIAAQKAALLAEPALDMVLGMSLQFVSPELPPDLQERFRPPKDLLVGESLPCILARRVAVEKVGRLDETMRLTAGYSWFAKAKVLGLKSQTLPIVVSRRRLHPNNWTRLNRAELKADALRAMREQIVRRRG